jgi:hypothetical protein
MAGLTPILVVWADAHADLETWTHPDEIEDTGEYLVRSIGWQLPAGEGGKQDHLTICQSQTPDGDVDHVLHIPIGMVRRTVLLDNHNM